jgi:hypothetical protein
LKTVLIRYHHRVGVLAGINPRRDTDYQGLKGYARALALSLPAAFPTS